MKNPTPKQIKAARARAGLSQAASAALIYKSLRQWAYYESGKSVMDLTAWELFQIKTENIE